MKPNVASLFLSLLLIVFALASCSLLPSGSIPSEAEIATMVAATVMAGGPAADSAPAATETAADAVVPEMPVYPIRVSFVNEAGNLFVWSDGTPAPVQLTTSGDVVNSYISFDGALVAFFRSGDLFNYQLDVINFDGTNQHTLFSASAIAGFPRPADSVNLVPGQVAWVPGTHTLALNFRVQYEGPGLSYTDSLYLVDGDTGSYVTFPMTSGAWHFTYSPDGTRMLISRPQGVDLYYSSGELVLANVITHEFVNTASEFAWVAQPTWRSDSSAFAVGILPVQPWGDDAGASVVYAASNTGAPLPASIFTVMKYYGGDPVVTFDPSLAYAAYAVPIGPLVDRNYALHINTLDGTSDTIVYNGAINDLPVWSPDSAHYIYTVGDPPIEQVLLGSFSASPLVLSAVTWVDQVEWIDDARFIVTNRSGDHDSLLLGTVVGDFSVIYNDPDASDYPSLEFDINN